MKEEMVCPDLKKRNKVVAVEAAREEEINKLKFNFPAKTLHFPEDVGIILALHAGMLHTHLYI